eukprot:CAMPEP_0184652102 /NCGR_PEP_ID=MMETSP0308-20130426/9781_1 /TAXON_ID=38269 /ORGANISM="Gloeochaete witrockiana, Strain SAG 46.84" /LENGTH=737 /DNA_ID=CAMNT_0027086771 /DNA_START=364 /DNA_END=2577 /DNA_ORIENTATION=+
MNGLRAMSAYNGAGVTVAVLGNSYGRQYAGADVLAGLLPGPGNPNGYTTPVIVVTDPNGGGYTPERNEGRAMLQIVHNMAPEAKLCFGGGGTSSFPDVIRAVMRAPCNADIVIDDLANIDVNPYLTHEDTLAVDYAASRNVLYFTAAGNHFLHDREVEMDLVLATDPSIPAVLKGISSIVEWNRFPAGTYPAGVGNGFLWNFNVPSAGELRMFWNQYRASDDLDIFFINRDMRSIPFSGTNDNIRTGNPQESVRVFTFRGFIAIGRKRTVFKPNVPALRIWAIFYFNRDLSLGPTEGQYARLVEGRRAARSAITVGAYNYSDLSGPVRYSNAGPALVYYDKSGKLINGIEGETRLKPVISGVDCTDHTFFSSGIDFEANGLPNFCGTSASVTYVGAFAALFRQAIPTLSYSTLIQAFMRTGSPWHYRAGYGLIDADAVLNYLLRDGNGGVEQPTYTAKRTPSKARTRTPLRRQPSPTTSRPSQLKPTPSRKMPTATTKPTPQRPSPSIPRTVRPTTRLTGTSKPIQQPSQSTKQTVRPTVTRKKPTATTYVTYITRTIYTNRSGIFTVHCDNLFEGIITDVRDVVFAPECRPPANSSVALPYVRRLVNKGTPVLLGVGYGWLGYQLDPCPGVRKSLKFTVTCAIDGLVPSSSTAHTFETVGTVSSNQNSPSLVVIVASSIGALVAACAIIALGVVTFRHRKNLFQVSSFRSNAWPQGGEPSFSNPTPNPNPNTNPKF